MFIRLVSFICHECQAVLTEPGAGLTKEGQIFIVGTCSACGEPVKIELATMVASLYTVPFAKESKLIH